VNGIAMDDTMTGLVGVGALILAAAMLPELRGSFRRTTSVVKERFNPVRLGVYMTYLMATVVMFLYGFYIEMNESKFGFNQLPAAQAVGDQVFTRTHLLLVFGSLPIIAIFLLAAELLGDTSGRGAALKRWMSGSILVGMVVATMGLGIWVFSTPSHATSWSVGNVGAILYIVGQVLILLGAAIELFMMRSLETQALSPIHVPSVLTPEGAGSSWYVHHGNTTSH
jgi:quinol-cytochrome oxidoreductase complex cytochrome b subunit